MMTKSNLLLATLIAAVTFSGAVQAAEISGTATFKQDNQATFNAGSVTEKNLIAREGGCRRKCGA